MGLNLSTSQIAKELNLNKDDAQKMAITLREGIVDKKEDTKLSGKVECDEVYIGSSSLKMPLRYIMR